MKLATLPDDTSTSPPVTAFTNPRALAPDTLHAPTRYAIAALIPGP